MVTQDRRRFIAQLLGGSAVTLVAPSWLGASERVSLEGPWSGTPREGLPRTEDPHDEAFWERVKGQFPLAPGLVLMNAANLCPSPYPVQEAVFRHTRDVDGDASFQNRAKFGELKEVAREALAAYVGALPSEIAITRNTSESNNTVINGLDLGPGDQVVIWDQNHPTNNVSWDVRADRWGFEVIRVGTPPGAATVEELSAPFLEALTPRTRVLAFSHLSNVSGVALPAAHLCREARARDILTLVDGAQTFGALNLDLGAMGCDFFTASSHKWFVGPKEAGLLYVREESQDRLWPSHVGVGWERAKESGAQKFENMGQRDDAAVVSMGTAAAFHEALGPDAVEARVRALAGGLKTRLRERIPGIGFHTPLTERWSGGVVVFSLPGSNSRQLHETLYARENIGSAAMGAEFEGLRLSPHIYNTMAEVDRVVEAVAAHA